MNVTNTPYLIRSAINETEHTLNNITSSERWETTKKVIGASLFALGLVGAAILFTMTQILPPLNIAIILGIGITSAVLTLAGVGIFVSGKRGLSNLEQKITPLKNKISSLNAQLRVQTSAEDNRRVFDEQQRRRKQAVEVDNARRAGRERTVRVPAPKLSSKPLEVAQVKAAAPLNDHLAKWVKDCNIENLVSRENIEVFKIKTLKYSELNLQNSPIAHQISEFERIMEITNVAAEDFNLFQNWIALDAPPQGHEKDPVLQNCICPISKSYPEIAVGDPVAKTTTYDKTSIEQYLNIKKVSPMTKQTLTKDKLIPLTDLSYLIQYRLYQLAMKRA